VPEIAQAARAGRPVVFVGLDGADWELLDEYAASGVMPNLARLVRQGRTGVLTTLNPPLSPLVWTTMATGVSPVEHGILDFTRLDPQSGAEEPITSDERRVPAVWNMATQAGKSVAVFGLWATYPAQPVRGLLVADRFFSFTSLARRPPPGIVYPPERETWAREALDRTEREVGFEALRAYLPRLSESEYREHAARTDPYAHPVSTLRRILVETRAYDALARDWIAREKPDLAIVYLQGTDTIGHVFAPFAPPRQETVSAADFARYRRVPELYFAEVDRLLGEYRRLAEAAGAVLMIASDHGFRWKEGRPAQVSSAAAATAGRWHRDEGVYLLWGPGIAKSRERDRGTVDQVCATLLALLGLPRGQGIAGPPLPGTPAGSGRTVDYRAHYRPAPPAADGGQEELAKLRSLGYVGKASRGAPGSTRTVASHNNEGLLLRAQGKTREAAAAFERAIALDPKSPAALWNLSDLLFAEGGEARDRADELLLQALAAGLSQGAERTIGRAIVYTREGDVERSLALLDGAVEAQPEDPRLWLFRGRYRLDVDRCAEALTDLERSARLDPQNPLTHGSLGLAHLCLGNPDAAAASFRHALEIDPDQPQIRQYLEQLGPAR
jgi:tetratricopeptide (TPR) repeat protein